MLKRNKQINIILLKMHNLEESLNSDIRNKLGLLRIGQDMKKRNPNFFS